MAVQKTAEKWKEKQWYNVYAPKVFGEPLISEIPAADDKSVMGRVIKVSLSWITKNPQHALMSVGLRVYQAGNGTAQTNLDYLEETYSYTHSLVKRHSSAIYTIDNVRSRDGKDFVLKLLLVTRSKIKTPKKTSIRKLVSAFAREYISAIDLDDFIKSVIDGKFQGEGAKRVQNIASIGKFEVKKIEL